MSIQQLDAQPAAATAPAPRPSLLRAEFDRLMSRRFVQIVTVLIIAAFAVTVAVTMAGSHQPSATEWASATEQARTNNQVNREIYENCLASKLPGATALERAQHPGECSFVEQFPEDHLYDTYVFRTSIRPLVGFLAAYLAFFGFLIAATFAGAELSSGGAVNLLLWRPQRMRVLGAKFAVVLGSVGVFSVVFSAVYVGTFYGIAKATGYVGSTGAAFMGDLALLTGRGVGLALVVTALSFGVAVIGRHTAAALGLLTAYVVVWEGGARLILEVLNARLPEPWFLSTYVGAWMLGDLQFYDSYATCYTDNGGCYEPDYFHVYWWHAAIIFAVLLAAVVGGAFAVFRKRDIT
ncbi:MAG: ABC transporter permease [Hamadaea sp.]|nr:ABC transporter permease [Hamadaea sp.]